MIFCSCEFVTVSRTFATIHKCFFAAGFCHLLLIRGYCCVLTWWYRPRFYHWRSETVPTTSRKCRCPDSETPAASESCSKTWPTSGWSDHPDTLPIVMTPMILANLLQTGKAVSIDTVQLTQNHLGPMNPTVVHAALLDWWTCIHLSPCFLSFLFLIVDWFCKYGK